MTDPQTYISSGILELYVSGKLTEAEADEVRLMADKYPEVQAEIIAIEDAIAETAMLFKAKPKKDLLADIMGEIEQKETPISLSQVENKVKVFNYKWLAIAAAIAFLLSLAFNVSQYQQIQQARQKIVSLGEEKEVFAQSLNKVKGEVAILSSPHYQKVPMTGTITSPSSLATIYFNKSEKRIFLNSGNLSIPDESKQFQLWAIINGQPVDAGVFDPTEGLIEIEALEGEIQAFAITLEKKGGSPSPTISQMYVQGALG